MVAAHGKESKVTRNPATDIKPSDIIQSQKKENYARIEIKEEGVNNFV